MAIMHHCACYAASYDHVSFKTHSNLATHANLSLSLQVRDMEMGHRYGEESCSEFGETHTHSHGHARSHSRPEEPPDLPMPTCFRSRSHSYLRAIQAGCSQDDDTASVDSDSPPPTATTVRTYSSSTGE